MVHPPKIKADCPVNVLFLKELDAECVEANSIVTLECRDGALLRIHRLILRRSFWTRKSVRGDFGQKETELVLRMNIDVPGDVMKIIRSFIYQGELKVTYSDVIPVYVASRKLGMEDLSKKLRNYLLKKGCWKACSSQSSFKGFEKEDFAHLHGITRTLEKRFPRNSPEGKEDIRPRDQRSDRSAGVRRKHQRREKTRKELSERLSNLIKSRQRSTPAQVEHSTNLAGEQPMLHGSSSSGAASSSFPKPARSPQVPKKNGKEVSSKKSSKRRQAPVGDTQPRNTAAEQPELRSQFSAGAARSSSTKSIKRSRKDRRSKESGSSKTELGARENGWTTVTGRTATPRLKAPFEFFGAFIIEKLKEQEVANRRDVGHKYQDGSTRGRSLPRGQ